MNGRHTPMPVQPVPIRMLLVINRVNVLKRKLVHLLFLRTAKKHLGNTTT
jgi:hypothetical protein